MRKTIRRPLSLALGVVATTALGGCYYGDVYGSSYASAGACPDAYYDYDPYSYDDGYGFGCYDPADYGGGFVQIGFGGGWYDDYYYPGYGMWMYDNYRNRYPLRGQYLNYWGGRRAWWKHRGDRGGGQWQGGTRPGNPPVRPGRPGGWQGHDGDRPQGTRPGRGTPPAAGHNPTRPDNGTAQPPRRPGGWQGRDSDRPQGTRPGGWQGRDGDRSQGTRPGRGTPPAAGNRPGGNGAVRPPRPAPEAGAPPPRASRPAPPPRATPPARPSGPVRGSRIEPTGPVREQ